MLVISLSSVHIGACFWCAVGRQIGKLMVGFLEFLNIVFHFQVYNINVSNSLIGGRTMMVLIVFSQHTIRMFLIFCYHQAQ